MHDELKLIPIAVRDFAVPSPRTGSIEAHSGYGRAAAQGQEIHARVQKKRTKSDPSYEAEVAISREFTRQGYRFRIDGRMDGIFRNGPLKVEEIKTSFNIRELARVLTGNALDHPYCLQLATYGYFTWLEHKVVPALSFHLVSTRNRDSLDLDIALDLPAYEKWLDLRLDELVHEAKEMGAPLELVRQVAETGKLPVPNFSAGGIATPADAALVRQLGAEAVFVGSGIFKSSDPEKRGKAIVKATTHFNDPKAVLEASAELGEAMKGLDVRQLEEKDLLQTRGW